MSLKIAHLPRIVPAAVLALLIGFAGPTLAASDIGVATKVVREALARTINKHLKNGDGLRFNEVVATGHASALQVQLTDDSTLTLGENAEIILDSMVYQPNTGVVTGTFRVLTGVLRFKGAKARFDMALNTPSGTIGIRGTEFDLLTTPVSTEINMIEGVVEVTSAAGAATVSAGESYRITGTGGGFLDAPSPELQAASARMLALISESDTMEATGASAYQTASGPANAGASSSAGSNRLVLELGSGPVIIELFDDLAPKHAARMRALAKQGIFDGLAFQFVRKGYVAETAAPPGAAETIAAEFSRQPFTRGIVGMSHPQGSPNGATGKFFIALGRAQVLDGKYTAWGKVVSGMEHLDVLDSGTLIKRLKPAN